MSLIADGMTKMVNPYNMELIEVLKRATMADYVPQVYPGRVTLFTTKEVLRWCRYEADRGWKHLVQEGLDIHHLPGTHLGMLDEPNVQILAKKLQVCLEQSQENHWKHPKLEKNQEPLFAVSSR